MCNQGKVISTIFKFFPLASFIVLAPGDSLASFGHNEEELQQRINSLNLQDVIKDARIYLEHMKNGSVANDRSLHLHVDSLNPSTMVGSMYMGESLSSMVELLQLGKVAYEVEHSLFGGATCTFCKAAIMFLQYYIDGEKEIWDVVDDGKLMCRGIGVGISGLTYEVCSGLVDTYAEMVVTVIKTSHQSPEQICGFVLGEACKIPHSPFYQWKSLVPPGRKARYSHINKVPASKYSGKPLTIVQLTDTHFDHLYKEGSNAACGEPLCCRESSGIVENEEDRAGYWGDTRKCDTPLRTIEAMYEHIAVTYPNVDLIYWTGDLPAHDIWYQTKEGNEKIVRETVLHLKKFFPTVPVLPVLGNHESVPVDSFPPPSLEHHGASMDWLYSTLAEVWEGWLGKNHKWSVKYGAYYSKNVAPGLRVITINTNYCANRNLWLLLNSTDPANQLRWLVFELQLAEFKGEKVHILGHTPPGHVDCVKQWSKNFNDIIARYANTVVAQFYGHTHTDEFQIFHSGPNKMPVNVAYIAPSVTPYHGGNPAYRVYDVSATGEVINHHTWVMDLEKANAFSQSEPPWYKLYSAKSAYKMESLSPISWQLLVNRLQTNSHMFNKFYEYYYSGNKARPLCDPACRHRLLCNLVSAKSHAKKETCKGIKVKGDSLDLISSWWDWSNVTERWSLP